MSWQSDPLSLECKSWRVLQIDGADCLLKGHLEDTNYHVMLSDLSTVWEETLTSEEIIQRSKALNPNIEVPLPVLLKRLFDDVTSSQSDSSFKLSTSTASQPHSLTLSLKTTLASLPYHWKFNLKKAPSNIISAHLVEPLLAMVGELSHREKEMVKLLIRKDKEIQDYKEQGAEVSRKYLETAPFTEETFTTQLTSSSNFAVRAHKSLSVLDNSSVQKLYTDVTRAKMWAQRNDGAIEEISDTLSSAQTVTSPVTSPVKKPPPESPSKEDEEARRKELERKLEVEKKKPKKKRRKLM